MTVKQAYPISVHTSAQEDYPCWATAFLSTQYNELRKGRGNRRIFSSASGLLNGEQ